MPKIQIQEREGSAVNMAANDQIRKYTSFEIISAVSALIEKYSKKI
jgi:hypothetical protein